MELIVINPSKLKITLSPPDMVKYALEGEGMEEVTPRTREAFRHIFRDARAESGFETEGFPLFIQLYASKGGGCEIFVTRLEGESNPGSAVGGEGTEAGESLLEDSLSPGEHRLLQKLTAGEVTPMALDANQTAARDALYAFEELPSLLAACRRLMAGGYRGRSAAYIVEDPRRTVWYLSLQEKRGFVAFVAGEYGEQTELSPLYAGEYGRVILPDRAVEVLGRL